MSVLTRYTERGMHIPDTPNGDRLPHLPGESIIYPLTVKRSTQGGYPYPRLSGDMMIISHSVHHVNPFSKSFSGFFRIVCTRPPSTSGYPCTLRDLSVYQTNCFAVRLDHKYILLSIDFPSGGIRLFTLVYSTTMLLILFEL